MTKTAGALGELTQAGTPTRPRRLITAMSDVARGQQITHLIVRSRTTAEPEEKARLMSEASRRMETPRLCSPHDFL
ncbi:hypothetical protein [Streptomyces sp. NPDC006335]|uniref:hypothetical protein n=1 Tax=Streptomyces sp. NPDC006335 TaxID=3156895 RepID=UPI0033B781D6